MSSTSPTPFRMSRAASHASSQPTSPPESVNDEEEENEKSKDDQEWVEEEEKEEKVPVQADSRFALLDDLLKKSALYTEKIGERMIIEQRKQQALKQQKSKMKQEVVDNEGGEEEEVKVGKKRTKNSKASTSKRKRTKVGEPVDEEERPLGQPSEITGAKLRDYQLQGVAWMAGLYQHDMNGILADEMGLGKTLQTISFLAHLREKCVPKPFLIVCPLSVLHNWIEEFEKFAPSIPVCMYHGNPTERSAIRKSRFGPLYRQAKEAKERKKVMMKMLIEEEKARALRKAAGINEEEEEVKQEEEDQDADEEYRAKVRQMPAIVTTYEMIIKDAKFLSNLDWGYIIVDEGHRLKNFEGKLITEIKKYDSANRLILTGTPLHNNLAELWSLLNFILPDLFTDLDSFQEWFNLSSVSSNDNAPAISEKKNREIVTKLHAILKPFLLRRVKADVESDLPPKKEYVLYTPLSDVQREAYEAVLKGSMRAYLLAKEEEESAKKGVGKYGKGPREKVDINAPRKTRSKGGKGSRKVSYNIDEDDETYFQKLEAGEIEDYREVRMEKNVQAKDLGSEYLRKLSVKKINSLKLQNTVMQLRKVCSHPYLFDWPLDPDTYEPIVNDQLVNASGKMMVLERLLDELFRREHKVLLFSQFTTMLDIVEEWAESFKGWKICRIDGSTPPTERREQMNLFQASLSSTSPDKDSSPSLFLLSTRAGGLGINLTAADTVIFFDNDWNPQMDLQAQDRAHRIGQKRSVLVIRLVSANTIESRILSRASERRRLEQMVIAKGKFRAPGQKLQTHAQAMADIHDSFALKESAIEVVPSTEAGKANVISEDVLESLLDRSWGEGDVVGKTKKATDGVGVGGKGKATFTLFEASGDGDGAGNLAKLFGEDIQ